MKRANAGKRMVKGLAGVLVLVLLSGTCAFANTMSWNTWTSSTAGSIGGVGTTFSSGGSYDNFVNLFPSYTPTSTYADGMIVSNAPTNHNNILQLAGGNNNLNTLQFSTPVVNPVMVIWSLGSVQRTASFNFNETPTFVAGGPSAEYGGSSITVVGNNVYGAEGNGTVEFKGTYSEISWTNPVWESWYGFNVGIQGVASNNPVPEPGTFFLIAAGLCSLAAFGLRRRSG